MSSKFFSFDGTINSLLGMSEEGTIPKKEKRRFSLISMRSHTDNKKEVTTSVDDKKNKKTKKNTITTSSASSSSPDNKKKHLSLAEKEKDKRNSFSFGKKEKKEKDKESRKSVSMKDDDFNVVLNDPTEIANEEFISQILRRILSNTLEIENSFTYNDIQEGYNTLLQIRPFVCCY